MPNKRGMTLVELLVAIAIIGVVVAITVPAVQASRERACITQCQANLRNIGGALITHCDVNGRFPKNTSRPWSLDTLPHSERESLWQVYEPSAEFFAPPNDSIGRVQIPMYACPTRDESMLPPFDLAPGHYAANKPILGLECAGITDGVSSTLLAYETAFEITWVEGPAFEILPMDVDYCRHKSCPVLFGDGSVHVLIPGTSRNILRAITTPKGGETVTLIRSR